jgi:hypothetical protein
MQNRSAAGPFVTPLLYCCKWCSGTIRAVAHWRLLSIFCRALTKRCDPIVCSHCGYGTTVTLTLMALKVEPRTFIDSSLGLWRSAGRCQTISHPRNWDRGVGHETQVPKDPPRTKKIALRNTVMHDPARATLSSRQESSMLSIVTENETRRNDPSQEPVS